MPNQQNFSIYKNKLTAFIAGILLIFTISISFMFTSFAGLLGDIDGNEKITASDARAVLRHSAQLEILDDNILEFADVDFNGMITAADARIVLRVAAQLQAFDLPEQKTENNTEKVTTDIETTTSETTTSETTEHTHNYCLTASVSGSCTNTGLDTYACDSCNDTYTENTPMTYHSTPYGKCEFCSQEINDVQLQLALAEHYYETGLAELEEDYQTDVTDVQATIAANMKKANVTTLYSADYYSQQIDALNNEIATLSYKLMDTSLSAAKIASYRQQINNKEAELATMKLLLETAQLQDSVSSKDFSITVKINQHKNEYLEKIETIKTNAEAIKCMCCLEVMEENSKDGFCDKCRILLDEKTIKIAEENTRYYSCLIELYVDHLTEKEFDEVYYNFEDDETYKIISNFTGTNSWNELIEYLEKNKNMATILQSQVGLTIDDIKNIINSEKEKYQASIQEEFDKKLTALETEHISILDSIEKKYS